MPNDHLPQQEPHLFSPIRIRGTELKNRIAVSPMCQYSSIDGMATDWHLVHLGSRAVGGAALVIVEATAIEDLGRISPYDIGIWDDKHIAPLARIARFIRAQDTAAGIQLAHAGRKACIHRPWDGGKPLASDEGAWKVVGPSPIPFADGYQMPCHLDTAEICQIVQHFAEAAKRAVHAGFSLIEIHSAHGYLLHSFLSPLSNHRTDQYGGSLHNRMRLVLEIAEAIRTSIPNTMPLLVRISATDWVEGGWNLDESVTLAKELIMHGVDLIDCSSGGLVPDAQMPTSGCYQVPFAEQIRRETGARTGAVGLITNPQQANEIIQSGKADMVLLGRELLRNPYWALYAAHTLGHEISWPPQYLRARD